MSNSKENELVSFNETTTNNVIDDDISSEDEQERLLKRPGPAPVLKELTEDDLLLDSSLTDDIIAAINEAKYIAPLLALMVLLVGMYLATDPFKTSSPRPIRMTHDEFKEVRPVLNVDAMADIYVSTFYAETKFKLPEPWYDHVSLKFCTATDKHGHHQPPDVFYGGVVYGVSASNPHNIEFSVSRRRLQDDELLEELRGDLEGMFPKPTAIFERYTENNETSFADKGFAVYFSLDDLKSQGMLSSDAHEPWKRTVEPILKVARDYRQVYITQWYPRQFGRQDVAAVSENPYRHTTVVRQIIPTRTGLNNIKSTAAVWLMWTNFTRPTIPDAAYKKPWTADDHWTHYPTESNSQK